MHELSLAMNIVKIVEQQAEIAGAREVKSIKLKIGDCSGVDRNSFDFSWPFAVKNTILEKAHRTMQREQAVAICFQCNHEFCLSKVYIPCPSCGSYYHNLTCGKDIKIVSMEII